MSIFDYPLDHSLIIRKKNKLVKQLLGNEDFKDKKIAILGGSTTSEVKAIMNLFLLSIGIRAEFYESEFNRYYEDALFSEELKEFNPDIVYIHTTVKNIDVFPNVLSTDQEVKELKEMYINKFTKMWNVLKTNFECVIIQNNFDYPAFRSLGNYDSVSSSGLTRLVNEINMYFSDASLKDNRIFINDINYLSAYIGISNWYSNKMWYIYKYAMTYEGIVHLAKNLSNIVASIYGLTKKCIVLDLDNTLWGGIVGDDGVNNLMIGNETAIGEAYSDFQHYIKQLKDRGITLAVCSKNDYKNAIDGLNHPDMILKESDFTNIKANWEPKSINIANIAKEINIGIDSLVFIDDNPAERELISQTITSVSVPNIGSNIEDYLYHLDRNGYFEPVNISNDDIKRNTYYQSNKERKELEASFVDYGEYLESLEMVADIDMFKDVYLDRITQLTNKTNQFNLTTKRYTAGEILNVTKTDDKIGLYGRLKDKFGDNGLVSVIIGSINGDCLNIDLWLMSCRVLKRDLEKAMFDTLVEYCLTNEISKIKGLYLKTKKNSMVSNHYKTLGFVCISSGDDKSEWMFNVTDQTNKVNKYIKIGEY